MGYQLAGFDVWGVDHKPQRRYPGPFQEADLGSVGALDRALAPGFDVVHASPPCQAYSAARTMTTAQGKAYPDLARLVVNVLEAWRARTGGLFIIENVPGAPIRPDAWLCGSSFGLRLADGHELRRHRIFQLGGFAAMSLPCDHRGPVLGVYGIGGGQAKRHGRYGDKATLAEARELMGCGWMTTREIAQAIPPAYTDYLGQWARRALEGIS
jgi:DNA (cytosine-5)-methyltransferase 1